jgi:N-acetylneuraminate synthase
MCGASGIRYNPSKPELDSLKGLKRGVFVNRNVATGEVLTEQDLFYAIPTMDNQLVVDDISKYTEFTVTTPIVKNEPVYYHDVSAKDSREDVLEVVKEVKKMIVKSGLAIPDKIELELSHHYGIENFKEVGVAILNCINREYCKKLLILLPGQFHPFHYHVKKEETFYVLHGDLRVSVPEENMLDLKEGEMYTVERGENHAFSSENGCIFEEVSTTHFPNDSFYEEKKILKNKNRKTKLDFYSSWLTSELK